MLFSFEVFCRDFIYCFFAGYQRLRSGLLRVKPKEKKMLAMIPVPIYTLTLKYRLWHSNMSKVHTTENVK